MVYSTTLELLVGLLHGYTKASKGPACPDNENEYLSSTSKTQRTDFRIILYAKSLHFQCLDMYPIDLQIHPVALAASVSRIWMDLP